MEMSERGKELKGLFDKNRFIRTCDIHNITKAAMLLTYAITDRENWHDIKEIINQDVQLLIEESLKPEFMEKQLLVSESLMNCFFKPVDFNIVKVES